MRHALRALVDGERAHVHRLGVLEAAARAQSLAQVIQVRRRLRVVRAQHRLDHLQRALVQSLRLAGVPTRAVQLRQHVVEVRDVQRRGPGEPVGERQRATVAKLSLFPLAVRGVRAAHLAEVLRHLGVVGPEHVLEALERALVRRLRGDRAVQHLAHLRQPRERLHQRRDVRLLVPRRLRRLPDAHGVRGELPRLLRLARLHLHLAELGHDLRNHGRLRAHEQLLRRQRAPKRLLALQVHALAPQRAPQLVVDAHRRDVRLVALCRRQRAQYRRRLARVPAPRQEVRQELLGDVRREYAVGGHRCDVRDARELRDDVRAAARRPRLGGHERAVRPGNQFGVARIGDFLLTLEQRVPVRREVHLRVLVPQVRVNVGIRQESAQRVPVVALAAAPDHLAHAAVRRRRVVLVFFGERRRHAQVLRPALGGGVREPAEHRGSEGDVKNAETVRRAGQTLDRPAVRLELSLKRLPLRNRQVRQGRRAAQKREDLRIRQARSRARDERRRLRHQRRAEAALEPVEDAREQIHRGSGKAVGLLHGSVRVAVGGASAALDLLRRQRQEQGRPGVLGGEQIPQRRGRGDAPAADALERRVQHARALGGVQGRDGQDVQELPGLLLERVHRAAPGGCDHHARRQRQRRREPVLGGHVVALGFVQPVQHHDDLAEERGVREEARERRADVLQAGRQVHVDVESRLELGAHPKQRASQIVGMPEQPERVREHERLGARDRDRGVRGGRGGRGAWRVRPRPVGRPAERSAVASASRRWTAFDLAHQRRQRGGLPASGRAQQQQGVGVPDAVAVLVKPVHQVVSPNGVRGVPLHGHHV